MYDIAAIENHRKEKLETLLLGKLDSVKAELDSKLVSLGGKIEAQAVREALAFAEYQDYGPGEYNRFYITHPIRVAGFCCDWMEEHKEYSTDFLVAALIHNVFEKEVLTQEECKRRYGDWIFRVIEAITPDREALKTEAGKKSYYAKIYGLPPMGQLLKLFDKFDNIYALCLNPDDKTRQEYLAEIREFIRPIAVKFHPSLVSYLDAQIEATAKLGYCKPAYRTAP